MLCPKCKSEHTRVELVRGSAFMAVLYFIFVTPLAIFVIAGAVAVIFFLIGVFVFDIPESEIYSSGQLFVWIALLVAVWLCVKQSIRIYSTKKHLICQACGYDEEIDDKQLQKMQKQRQVQAKPQVQKQKNNS